MENINANSYAVYFDDSLLKQFTILATLRGIPVNEAIVYAAKMYCEENLQKLIANEQKRNSVEPDAMCLISMFMDSLRGDSVFKDGKIVFTHNEISRKGLDFSDVGFPYWIWQEFPLPELERLFMDACVDVVINGNPVDTLVSEATFSLFGIGSFIHTTEESRKVFAEEIRRNKNFLFCFATWRSNSNRESIRTFFERTGK